LDQVDDPFSLGVGAEEIVGDAVLWLKLAVEAVGALIVGPSFALVLDRAVFSFDLDQSHC
jgi:hypothetical protein